MEVAPVHRRQDLGEVSTVDLKFCVIKPQDASGHGDRGSRPQISLGAADAGAAVHLLRIERVTPGAGVGDTLRADALVPKPAAAAFVNEQSWGAFWTPEGTDDSGRSAQRRFFYAASAFRVEAQAFAAVLDNLKPVGTNSVAVAGTPEVGKHADATFALVLPVGHAVGRSPTGRPAGLFRRVKCGAIRTH